MIVTLRRNASNMIRVVTPTLSMTSVNMGLAEMDVPDDTTEIQYLMGVNVVDIQKLEPNVAVADVDAEDVSEPSELSAKEQEEIEKLEADIATMEKLEAEEAAMEQEDADDLDD